MDAIKGALNGSGVYLIDDAAQAMGARYKGAWVGTLGDAGLFSFSRGKNITTVDGGVIITDQTEIAGAIAEGDLQPTSKLQQWVLIVKAGILSLLLKPYLYWIPQKLPSLKLGISVFDPDFPMQRFTGCQAAIGRRMLLRLQEINTRRCKVASLYRLGGWETVRPINGAEPVFLRFPALLVDGCQVDDPVHGIVVSYPTPLGEINSLRPHVRSSSIFPGAISLASRMRTLPTHEHVTDRDVDIILEKIRRQ